MYLQIITKLLLSSVLIDGYADTKMNYMYENESHMLPESLTLTVIPSLRTGRGIGDNAPCDVESKNGSHNDLPYTLVFVIPGIPGSDDACKQRQYGLQSDFHPGGTRSGDLLKWAYFP